MSRYTLLAVASLGLAACAGGCQKSGEAEASVDADRPQMTADASASGTRSTYTAPAPAAAAAPAAVAAPAAAVDTSAYSVAYVTTADTPWMRTSTDALGAGTLKSGETIYLRTDAPTTGMVAARTSDNRIVYVRASDVRKK
ncbi:MAG: hypothetical protein WBD40_21545 [Tepidisphaeraceae bacterium]